MGARIEGVACARSFRQSSCDLTTFPAIVLRDGELSPSDLHAMARDPVGKFGLLIRCRRAPVRALATPPGVARL